MGARREGVSDDSVQAESQGGVALTPLERLRLPSLANAKNPSPLDAPVASRCAPRSIGPAATVGPQRYTGEGVAGVSRGRG